MGGGDGMMSCGRTLDATRLSGLAATGIDWTLLPHVTGAKIMNLCCLVIKSAKVERSGDQHVQGEDESDHSSLISLGRNQGALLSVSDPPSLGVCSSTPPQ